MDKAGEFNPKNDQNPSLPRKRGYDEIYARATSPEYIRKRINFNENGDPQSIECIELGKDGKAQSIERTEYGEKGRAQSIQDIQLGENGEPQHIRFKDIESRRVREHIKFGKDGEIASIERLELREDGEIQSIKSIALLERRLELAKALVDEITTYLNDYDVDLLFMERRNYFTNFKEQFEKFKNSVSEAQHDLTHLTEGQRQLESLFNGVDKLRQFKEAITKADYKNEDDYQPFIESNQDLEEFPIYKKLLTYFDNFQDHITQDEEHLESLLDSHEVNIRDLSQKSQALTKRQKRIDNLFQGAQEVKKFDKSNEPDAIDKASPNIQKQLEQLSRCLAQSERKRQNLQLSPEPQLKGHNATIGKYAILFSDSLSSQLHKVKKQMSIMENENSIIDKKVEILSAKGSNKIIDKLNSKKKYIEDEYRIFSEYKDSIELAQSKIQCESIKEVEEHIREYQLLKIEARDLKEDLLLVDYIKDERVLTRRLSIDTKVERVLNLHAQKLYTGPK